jgi:hypothetical protein
VSTVRARHGNGRLGLGLALLLALVCAAAWPQPAGAARGLDVGFADRLYEGPDSNRWLGETKRVNADVIRVNMSWRQVAFNKPDHPRDPSDPAYNWDGYDTAIANAVANGFDVDLTVFWAPDWAEGPNRPSFEKAPPGSWRPDASAFGDFAHAVAKRYSGTYDPTAGSGSGGAGGGGGLLPGILRADGTLPPVRYFEAWNEPNLGTYITPQFAGGHNQSASIYRALLNAFYDGVKAEAPNAQVVSGGTAPYGDPPGPRAQKTGPLRFARELMCLNSKLRRTKCPVQAKFDIYAHHPINRAAPPTAHGPLGDDVMIADFGDLRKTVRRAEQQHTLGTGGGHKLWANEVWWQTDPPDKDEGVPPKTQARWMQQALYMLWKQGASNVSFLQFRDDKHKAHEYTLDTYQTGVYTYSNRPKPSARGIAFPFVTDRKSKSRLIAWGKAPRAGKLVIQANPKGRGGWHKVRKLHVKEGSVFKTSVHMRGPGKLRAQVGKSRSIPFLQKR